MAEEYIALICSYIWGWPMIILLLGTHLFLTIRLRFPQRALFTAIRLSVRSDKKGKGDVTPFGALTTALAATIGTGNIIGVATAVALGGPGAVFWCWLTGVLGFSTKYAEGLLAVKYREVTSDGTMAGGPMYVLEKGLGLKWLAVLFAIFTAVAALGIGNTVQANSIATLMNETFSVHQAVTGAVLALLTAMVVLFGIGAIARFCSYMVPFMAGIYVLGCIAILMLNFHFLPETFATIFQAAFTPKAFGSGL
ncbi:MAG: alanine/glycine:cation symporter family protein, partial [Bacteroidales bacterium]